MSKFFSIITIACVFIFFTSCKKDEGKLPNIAFKTISGFTYANDTVAKGATILMGITASKAEDKDVLKTFDVSQVYDNGTSTSIGSETLTGNNADNYSKDVTIITRNQVGTEQYTFTVVNKDGLKNSVTLTLTVQ